MAVATRTLLQICQEVARNLGAYENSTNTAAASTSGLTCANYPFITSLSNADTTLYVGCEVYPTAGTENTNARMVVTYAPSTGVFGISPAWSTGMAAADTFDLYLKGLRIAQIKTAINTALRQLWYVTIYPLSLVTDADMETSGVTNWAATSAASSKVSTAGNLLRGNQSLRVLNSGANGYAQSATMSITKDDSFYVEAYCRAAVGTGTLIAYDITNSANIDTASWDEIGWGKVYLTFSAPSTCEQIAIRLQGTGASDDIYWDDVNLLRVGTREILLPDWITHPSQVRHLLTDVAGRDRWDESHYIRTSHYRIIRDESNTLNPLKLSLEWSLGAPLWIEANRTYAELSADTGTTTCNRELIECAATVELLDKLINRAPGEVVAAWKQEYARQSKKLQYLLYHKLPSTIVGYGDIRWA